MLLSILTAWDSGREDILAGLIDSYTDKLLSIAIGILENKEDAEEVVNDTFLEAYYHIDDFVGLDKDEKISLLVIYTKNNARDRIRKRNRKRKVELTSLTYYDNETEEMKEFEVPDESSIPENILINEENSRKIAAYIDRLNDEQHDVIVLKYYYGMNDKMIAKRLKISITAVSSRLTRARNTLHKMMKGESL